MNPKHLKIVKKTKKYTTLTIPNEFLPFVENTINTHVKRIRYEEWFYDNHTFVSYDDDYGSYGSCWVSNKTGQQVFPTFMVSPGMAKFRKSE
jgi:hypothetical protein